VFECMSVQVYEVRFVCTVVILCSPSLSVFSSSSAHVCYMHHGNVPYVCVFEITL